MVVSLAFVNGFHYWPVIKRFPPCSTSTHLFAWLGFVPLLCGLDWRPWANSSIVIFCYCPSCARPCYILYDILLRHIFTLYFLWLWSIIEYGSTLFICGHDSFRFDMAPFCILSNHDSFISYTYVGSALYLYGDVLYMEYVLEISFSDIYLSFRYLHLSLLILDSLLSPYSAVSFIMYFGYHLPL